MLKLSILTVLASIGLIAACKNDSSKNEPKVDIETNSKTFSQEEVDLLLLKEKIKVLAWEMRDRNPDEYSAYEAMPKVTSLPQYLLYPSMSSELSDNIEKNLKRLGVTHSDSVGAVVCLGVWGMINEEKGLIDRYLAWLRGELAEDEDIVEPMPINDIKVFREIELYIGEIIDSLSDESKRRYAELTLDVQDEEKHTAKRFLYGDLCVEFCDEMQGGSLQGIVMSKLTNKQKKKLEAMFSKLGVFAPHNVEYIINVEIWMRENHGKSILRDLIIFQSDMDRMLKLRGIDPARPINSNTQP